MDIDIKVDEPYANAKYIRLELTKIGISSMDKETETPTTKDYVTYMLEIGNGLQILKNQKPKLVHFAGALQKIVAENCFDTEDIIEGKTPTTEDISKEISLLMAKNHLHFVEA